EIDLGQGSDAEGVLFRSLELEGQVIVVQLLIGVVSIDKGRGIDIVDHQVQVPVIVQVGIGDPIGKGGGFKAPGHIGVFKSDVPIVPKGIIGLGIDGHPGNDRVYGFLTAGQGHFLHDLIGKEIDKIQVGEVVVDPVGDKDILETVVVHIKDQSRPTPIGGRRTTVIGHLCNTAVPIAQLKVVLVVLLVKVLVLFEIKDIVSLNLHYGLDPLLLFG